MPTLLLCRRFACLTGLTLATVADAADVAFRGDVTDVRVIRHMDQHPGSSELWEPYLAQWRGKHLVAAFGVKIPGKTDMGDIMASVSTNDGRALTPASHFDSLGARLRQSCG